MNHYDPRKMTNEDTDSRVGINPALRRARGSSYLRFFVPFSVSIASGSQTEVWFPKDSYTNKKTRPQEGYRSEEPDLDTDGGNISACMSKCAIEKVTVSINFFAYVKCQR
jgi:hypothetical protein